MKTPLRPVLVWISIAFTAATAYAGNVAVILSSDASAYQEALEGFREVVRHRIVGVQTLKENSAGWSNDLKKLRSAIEPDLIVAIGTSALQAVSTDITNIPIVHAMVFNPSSVVSPDSKNVFGISMNPSTNHVMTLLKELNPKYHRIGVIFDPSRSGSLIFLARSVAQREGLQLVTREIRSSGDIAAALNSLQKEIDILWLLPDEMYLTDDILQRVFLFSFDRKMPVLGLSERHTQMGALLSLSYASARDMGRQAGEAVNQQLSDSRILVSSQLALRRTRLTVNLKAARKLDIEIPESIVRRADNAVKTPNYKEGDWWIFKVKAIEPNGKFTLESYKVVFKNGVFESDDVHFLTGVDQPGQVRFLPFASVYIDDRNRKWLDFPLIAGKRWSFTYHADRTQRTNRRPLANAEVIGETGDPIVTPAGMFRSIEIQRTDYLTTRERTHPAYLTYFYSPETKSVVKLKAEIDYWHPFLSGWRYELELVAYGADATGKKDSR